MAFFDRRRLAKRCYVWYERNVLSPFAVIQLHIIEIKRAWSKYKAFLYCGRRRTRAFSFLAERTVRCLLRVTEAPTHPGRAAPNKQPETSESSWPATLVVRSSGLRMSTCFTFPSFPQLQSNKERLPSVATPRLGKNEFKYCGCWLATGNKEGFWNHQRNRCRGATHWQKHLPCQQDVTLDGPWEVWSLHTLWREMCFYPSLTLSGKDTPLKVNAKTHTRNLWQVSVKE